MATAWITWTQAAELTGLPVPTIDYNSRIGRIRTRPHHGSRPCVDRDSALAFSRWYRDRAERRVALKVSKEDRAADRRRRRAAAGHRPRARTERPGPRGWLTGSAAAKLFGSSPGHLAAMARKGTVEAVRAGARWWYSEASVIELAADRREWVSMAVAARVAGCAPGTIVKAVREGRIDQRTVRSGVPSISRASLDVWAAARKRELERKQAERRRRDEQRRARSGVPPGSAVWLGTETTALLLGLSPGRVRQLARADRLPHAVHGGRLWFARHHMEQIAAARALTKRRERRTGAGLTKVTQDEEPPIQESRRRVS